MEIEKAILNRVEIPELKISIPKMLRACGMELYSKICINRIFDLPVDKENHILFFVDSDMQIDVQADAIGIEMCKGILSGYISEGDINICLEQLKLENETISAQNAQIKALKQCPSKNIRHVLNNINKYFYNNDDTTDSFRDLLKKELKARSIFNKARVLLMRAQERIKEKSKAQNMAHIIRKKINVC